MCCPWLYNFDPTGQQNTKTSHHTTPQSPVTSKRKSSEDTVPDVEGSAKKRYFYLFIYIYIWTTSDSVLNVLHGANTILLCIQTLYPWPKRRQPIHQQTTLKWWCICSLYCNIAFSQSNKVRYDKFYVLTVRADSESAVGQSPSSTHTSVLSVVEGSREQELSVTRSASEKRRNHKKHKTSNK